MTPRFHRPASAAPSAGPDRELREAVAAAARSTARFRYRSAVSDPFNGFENLGGWEDAGLVDFRAPAAWFRRVWLAPGTHESSGPSIGVLGADGAVALHPDGTARRAHGAPHLVDATSNPVGLLRLIDPAFTSAAPAGPGRWRIAIDVAGAAHVLGASAFGPGGVPAGSPLAAIAQLRDGRPEVIGVSRERHAWAAVRFSDWGVAVPAELEAAAPGHADFGVLHELLPA